MASLAIFLALGLSAGVLSGIAGIGGAILIVPILVFGLGFTQHKAQGTTLAMMVPPIGFLAAWTYWREGNTDLKAAAIMAVAFFVGGLIGAKIANSLSNVALQKVFGVILLMISLKMIIGK